VIKSAIQYPRPQNWKLLCGFASLRETSFATNTQRKVRKERKRTKRRSFFLWEFIVIA
jgi:hypothetical protein